jgi:hypothetical protein
MDIMKETYCNKARGIQLRLEDEVVRLRESQVELVCNPYVTLQMERN